MARAEVLAAAGDPRHWQLFYEHCAADKELGGPDPHAKLAGYLVRDLPLVEKVWRLGVLVSVWNVPAAEAIWRRWTRDELLATDPVELEAWLRIHWAGLPLRRERKSVNSPPKLARCLQSYAAWMADYHERIVAPAGTPEERYEAAWAATGDIYAFARYASLKILDLYAHYADAPIELPDLRPAGGKSPREALVLLFPGMAGPLLDGDDPDTLATVNAVAEEGRHRLLDQFGLELTRHEFQVFLCNYKQTYITQRHYPGRSLDSELAHVGAVEAEFAYRSDMWDARKQLFPLEALGELHGWLRPRDELGTVMRTYGYVWTDLRFDYGMTMMLSDPARKNGA